MLPTTIRASVHEDAIARVSAFFNASAEDILREVLQNARRSIATRVEVTVGAEADADGRRRVEIADNGCGMNDPAALLAFGYSGWDGRTHEHPAGMGWYALAGTDCTVTSRTALMDTGWQVTLGPAHYRGEAAARVERAPEGTPVGTRIVLPASTITEEAVGRAARYLTVDVKVNGKRVEQAEFQARYGHAGVACGADVSFPVTDGYLSNYEREERAGQATMPSRETTINFHGHLVHDDLGLPAVIGMDHHWRANVDVHECGELQLVLPARKEVVRNAFAADLRRRAEQAIFTVLDARSEAPKLPYATWRRGCEVLGHTMQRQPVTLTPWSPTTPENANRRTRTDTGGPRRPEDDALLIGADMPAPLQVMLAEALAEAGTGKRPLYEAEPRYAGYDEYDRLERVRKAWVMVTELDGTRHRSDDGEERGDNRTVREIELVLEHGQGDSGAGTQLRLPCDVGFCSVRAGADPAHVGILVKEHAPVHPEALERMLTTAFYSRNDDYARSDETQREDFARAAREQAEQVLLPDTTALERAIQRALDEHAGPLLRDRGRLTIRYEAFRSCRIEAPGGGAGAANKSPVTAERAD